MGRRRRSEHERSPDGDRAATHQAPTIRDVAREAGVGISTVSRVLNGNGYASAEVRAQVEAAAQRLAYRPSRRAKSLRGSTSQTIAAIMPELVNPVYLEFLRGVQRTASTRGYAVIIGETQRSRDQERRLVHRLVEEGIDGVVLGGPLAPEDAEILRAHEIEMRPDGDRGSRAYGAGWLASESEATLAMVEHLTELGHREVMAVAARTPLWTQGLGYRRARTDVIRTELRRHGTTLDVVLAAPDELERACRARLDERAGAAGPGLPTAFIACSHPVVPPLLTAIRDAGMRIPADASFVAYGDSDWAAANDPALSVVRHDTFAEAAWFTGQLLDAIDGVADPDPQPVVSAEFVARASLGPPPGTG